VTDATARKATPPEPDDVADAFFATTKVLRRRANEGLRNQGITMARGRLLKVLAHRGPSRIGAVADKLGIGPRSATEAVDALERDGLVRRTPDPTDRRAVLVALTDRGTDLIRKAEGPGREVVRGLFAVLSPDERAELFRLLGVVRTAAEAKAPE
jgi:DNA-binding MarR family transcriptional regulator